MKYLKRFNESDDYQPRLSHKITPEMVHDVEDILAELSDTGVVDCKVDTGFPFIRVEISTHKKFVRFGNINYTSDRNRSKFNIGIIKEYVLRLVDYLKEYEVYIIDVADDENRINAVNNRVSLDELIQMDDYDTQWVVILFKKKGFTFNESKEFPTYDQHNDRLKSIDKLEQDISDCFLEANDLWKVKIIRNPNFQEWYQQNIDQRRAYLNGKEIPVVTEKIEVSIGLDSNVADIDKMKQTEWGVEYRPVINGEEIVEELVDAIVKCEGYTGLKIKRAEVKWVNAGEWGQKGKQGLGPGMMSKIFKPGGGTGPIHNPTKGSYSTDMLIDFMLDKGDRLRNLKIEYWV